MFSILCCRECTCLDHGCHHVCSNEQYLLCPFPPLTLSRPLSPTKPSRHARSGIPVLTSNLTKGRLALPSVTKILIVLRLEAPLEMTFAQSLLLSCVKSVTALTIIKRYDKRPLHDLLTGSTQTSSYTCN